MLSGVVCCTLQSHCSRRTQTMTWATYSGLTVQRGGAGGLEGWRVGELEGWRVGELEGWGVGVWSEWRCQMLAAVSENSPKSLVLSIKTSITDYSHKNIPSAC